MDLTSYINDSDRWGARLREVSEFPEPEGGLSVSVHSASFAFSVVFSGEKEVGLDNLHEAREWLRTNLGHWSDSVLGMTGVRDSYHINFGNKESDFQITWITEDEEVLSLYLSPGCKFIPRKESVHFKDVVCLAKA